MSKTFDLAQLEKWYEAHALESERDFFTFLKFPSISAESDHNKSVHQAAQWVLSYLQQIGMHTELWETVKHPVVYASSSKGDPSRPTVLIYQHYDVQPVDPLDKWETPPFEPTVRNGSVYARGASDNKGQCFSSLLALKATLSLFQDIPVNIKLFIEGEEECGSLGSTQILAQKKKELKADYLLVVDAGFLKRDEPAITLGFRGITTLQVTCRNSTVDLHSGIHGGVVLNPNRVLVELLSQLWDKEGRIAIPGFYDQVEKIFPAELKQIDQTVDVEELKKNFGIQATRGEGGYSLWESNTLRPSLEINGLGGGYIGPGFKTVIPSQAVAKLSCRLVPNQDPHTVFSQISSFLRSKTPPGITLEIEEDHGGKAVRTSPGTKIAKIAANAYEEVFKKPCKKIFCGASVPIVSDLQEASGAEPALIGVGLSEDDIHAPNEHFDFVRLKQGFLVMGLILKQLSETP